MSCRKKLDNLVKSYAAELLTNIRSIVGIGERTAGVLIVMTGGLKDLKMLNSYPYTLDLLPQK